MKAVTRRAAMASLVGLVVLAWCGRSFGQTETVFNGGFELGTMGWQLGSAPGAEVTTNAPHYSGTRHLAISTVPNLTQKVFQTITLPANPIAATFSCYYNIQPADGGNVRNAQMWIRISDAAGTLLTNVLSVYNTDRDPVQGTYHQVTCDLTRFINQPNGQLQVQFWVSAAATALSGGTVFNIDNVSLLAADVSARPANDAFDNAADLLTNTAAIRYATNTYATKEPGEPKHAGNAGGHSVWWTWTAPDYGTVSLTTAGSNFDTVLAVYTGTAVNALTAVASNHIDNSGQTPNSAVNFKVSPGTQYRIAVDGYGGATGILLLNLKFKPNTTPPTLSFTSPASGAKVTNSTLTVTGKASSGFGVARVTYRLENTNGFTEYLPATGTTSWSATVSNLTLGANTVWVQAYDTSSNLTTIRRTFTYVLGADYSLTINGTGTVSPDLKKQLLEVGKTYTLTAKPGKGYVFSNWTGTITSSAAKLAFVMPANMALEANFIPNPFTPVKGTYAGLFTNSTPETNSGFFTATLTDKGSFSARVQTDGRTYPLSGQFALDGSFVKSIVRRGQDPLWVQLQLDLTGGDLITGTVTNGPWSAALTANRAVFSKTTNPAPQGGRRYTLAMALADDPEAGPGGYGFGALSVDLGGNLSFSGTLGDGTKVTQKSFVSKDGTWPLYLSLYSNQGVMFGWLSFTNSTDGDLSGVVHWSKPAQTKAKLYPAGFVMEEVDVVGSAYTFIKGTPVLALPDGGVVALEDGNLAERLSARFELGLDNKVVGADKLAVTINTATGLFQGSVPHPDTGKRIAFSGALLQKVNFGAGCFLGTNRSGSVSLGPVH